MIDGLSEFLIGFIILLVGVIYAIIICMTCYDIKYTLIPFAILLSVGGTIMISGVIQQNEEQLIKTNHQNIILDTMSCKELGEYIINNSMNSTYDDGGYANKSYQYAQAKYLVCTHTQIGVSP